MSYIMVLTTCASKKEARAIAKTLLARHIIACANIVGLLESKFWWRGRIGFAKETLLIMKTRKANFACLEKAVKRLHSYDVPEIIALPIIAGNKDYLDWIGENS